MRLLYFSRSLALLALLFVAGQGMSQDVRTAGSLSQTGGFGTLRGTIYDKETGEGLIGASVVLEGTSYGANTDLDGNYTVRNVPAGVYKLKVTYVSYQTQVVSDVRVQAGAVTVQNAYLVSEAVSVGEVQITARQVQSTESSILNFQKLSAATLDGLSVQSISRIGDSDVGTAIGRIVGMTVEDGKYAYIRGLGDRYSKTLINGAEIPSLDFNRNAVQIDLFPTNLIDNLVVYKTFTPDLPGNFSGGLVNISTKDFPEKFTLFFSMTGGYNTNSTGNNKFLTYEGGNTDFLGFDDGTREEPSIARTSQENLFTAPYTAGPNAQADASFRNNITRAFNRQMVGFNEAPPLDHGFQFTIGNQMTLFGKSFGYVAALNYRRNYTHYEGERGLWVLNQVGLPSLFPNFDFRDVRSTSDVTWSGLINLSMRLNDNNKVLVNYMRNQAGERAARYLNGRVQLNTLDDLQESRVLDYNQRSNDVFQLRGEHVVPGMNNLRIEWIGAYVNSVQDQPDYRLYANIYQNGPDGRPDPSTYVISLGSVAFPQRLWRYLDEANVDSRLHITYPFQSWTGADAKFKFGGSYTFRDRTFSERNYNYDINLVNGALAPFGNPFQYRAFGATNPQGFWNNNGLVLINSGDPSAPSSWTGLNILSAIQDANQYQADEIIIGAYGMVDIELIEKLRFIGGARYEKTETNVIPGPEGVSVPGLTRGELDLNDILPLASLVYGVTEKINVRAGYSRTLARPIFREFAPFANFGFAGDFLEVGNSQLRRTLIDNIDLRFEWFPDLSEVVAVSAFYKRIQNPIEKAFNTRAGQIELTWQNVPEATVYGVEVEVRKNLAFITYALRHFQVGVNASYIFSQVDVPPQELAQGRNLDPNMADTRPLFSQSPYVVNANMAYINDTLGTTVSLAFNVWGERLAVVAAPGTPNVFEQPRPSLDFNYVQRLGRGSRFSARLQALNILNPEVALIHAYNGQEFAFSRYREGRRFNLSLIYQIK